MKKIFLILFLSSVIYVKSVAQYSINGSAILNSCHCYTLTQNVGGQFGAVWNNNRIDLNQSFDFTFQVFLGCVDGNGADGIAFVLQNSSTTIGTTGTGGGSMGYFGISPAVGVTLDTYQNSSPDNDPYYDHIAIQLNGNTDHNNANTITPLTPASSASDNIEDCQNHTLRIVWNAVTKTMTVYFDNVLRLTATNDFVNTVFGGNSQVYWGFTGATGGLSNLQQFCTQLTPSFHFLPDQKKCVNEPITFYDSTVSFSTTLIRVWDFGDGTPTVSNIVNPTHTYTTPGDKTVTLTVTTPDGCQEVFTQVVHVGSKPLAGFSYSGSCVNSPILFTDTSHVTVGTINSWYWYLDNNGQTAITPNTFSTYTTGGIKHMKFIVKTLEGCSSDTLYRDIVITDRPQVDFTFTDSVCLGTPTSFNDASTVGYGSVNYWQWTYSDSSFPATLENPSHVFLAPGPHNVTLVTSSSGGAACAGNAVTHSVFVADKPVAGMKYTIVCERQSVQFFDSSYSSDGLPITQCWWDLGNGQFSNQCNPTVTYAGSGPITVKHVVWNSRGCKSDTMTITINVADKPIVKFGFSTPVCNDSSLHFTDSSTVTNGVVNQWNWIHDNTTFSAVQNPTGYFPFGDNQVGLSVTSNLGCYSDTVYKPFRLIRNPVTEIHFNDTCKYSPVVFTANETTTQIGITDWQWYFGDNQSAAGMPVTHTYTANGQFTITLYVTSVEGCRDTASGVINIYGTNAYAGPDVIAAPNQPIQLQASGGISYQWTPGDGLSSTTVANPVATVTEDHTYYLMAYTPTGCKSYDTLKIKVYKGPQCYMPTAFTPNGDHLNEIVKPFLVGMTKFNYFAVYNRYGQLIFYSTDAGKGWDGKFRGREQPVGSYIWVVQCVSWDSFGAVPKIFRGNILLLR